MDPRDRRRRASVPGAARHAWYQYSRESMRSHCRWWGRRRPNGRGFLATDQLLTGKQIAAVGRFGEVSKRSGAPFQIHPVRRPIQRQPEGARREVKWREGANRWARPLEPLHRHARPLRRGGACRKRPSDALPWAMRQNAQLDGAQRPRRPRRGQRAEARSPRRPNRGPARAFVETASEVDSVSVRESQQERDRATARASC